MTRLPEFSTPSRQQARLFIALFEIHVDRDQGHAKRDALYSLPWALEIHDLTAIHCIGQS